MSPARPPVPSKENNPLCGVTQSRVDMLGLQETVRTLRQANKSYADIQEYINSELLKDSNFKLSLMSIQRWCKKNLTDDEDKDVRYINQQENYAVNVYGELLDLVSTIDEQINTLKILNEEFRQNKSSIIEYRKDLQSVATSIEKLTARKQGLLVEIARIQKEIYSYQTVSNIITMMLEMIQEEDILLHAKVLQKVKENVIFQEALRKIIPADKQK